MPRSEHLYHVTLLDRLFGMTEAGILPNDRSTNLGIGHRGPDQVKLGTIQLSDFRSVPEWMKRLQRIANAGGFGSDDMDIPIAVRIDIGGLEISIKEKVLPHRIQVWTGKRWVPLRQANLSKFLFDLDEAQEEGMAFEAAKPKRMAARLVKRYLEENDGGS